MRGIEYAQDKAEQRVSSRRAFLVAGAGVAIIYGMSRREGESAREKEIRMAMDDWRESYDCDRPVRVEPFINTSESLPGGLIRTVLEEAEAGVIRIGPEGDARNIVIHSMTHACVPDEPTLLAKPLEFLDGKILGFHGLGILVELNDGTQTKFTKMEEGWAERNATAFSGYQGSDDRYYRVGSLALDLFPLVGRSENFAEANDVPGFVGGVMGISRNEVGAKEIEQVMTMFMDAWDEEN